MGQLHWVTPLDRWDLIRPLPRARVRACVRAWMCTRVHPGSNNCFFPRSKEHSFAPFRGHFIEHAPGLRWGSSAWPLRSRAELTPRVCLSGAHSGHRVKPGALRPGCVSHREAPGCARRLLPSAPSSGDHPGAPATEGPASRHVRLQPSGRTVLFLATPNVCVMSVSLVFLGARRHR